MQRTSLRMCLENSVFHKADALVMYARICTKPRLQLLPRCCAPLLPRRSGLPPAKAPETCSRRYPRDRSTPTSTPRSMFSTTPPRSTRTSSRYSQTFIRFRRVGWLVTQALESSFSAVPKPIFATTRSFCSIFQGGIRWARICTVPNPTFEALRIISFFNLVRKQSQPHLVL